MPPLVGVLLHLLQFLVTEVTVAADAQAVPRFPHSLTGLPHLRQRRIIQTEPVGGEYRFVAHAGNAQSFFGEGTRTRLAHANSGRNPPVGAGGAHPRPDCCAPGGRIPHRVAGCQAHRAHHAVCDGSPMIWGEHGLLIAAGGEV